MKFYLRALELSPGFPPSQGNLGSAYLHNGDSVHRLNGLLAALKGEKEKALSFSEAPEVYALLGLKDHAIRSMKKIIQDNSIPHGYPYLKLLHDPLLDLLRGDPAFVEIVANAKAVYQAAGFLPSATAR